MKLTGLKIEDLTKPTMYILFGVLIICAIGYLIKESNIFHERFTAFKLPEDIKEARINSGAADHPHYDYYPNHNIIQSNKGGFGKPVQPYKILKSKDLKPKESDAINICTKECNADSNCIGFVYYRKENKADFYNINIDSTDIQKDNPGINPATHKPYPIGNRETFLKIKKRKASYGNWK